MRKQGEGGFTILEVTIAMALITLGLIALIAVFPGVLHLSRVSRETEVAYSAARSKLDEMRSVPFYDPSSPSATTIFDAYNNATFTVVGLLAPQGGGPIGKITFLTEAQAASLYNISLDLNLNGVTNEAVVSKYFTAFPVKVEVSWWDDPFDTRTVTVNTIIYNNLH